MGLQECMAHGKTSVNISLGYEDLRLIWGTAGYKQQAAGGTEWGKAATFKFSCTHKGHGSLPESHHVDLLDQSREIILFHLIDKGNHFLSVDFFVAIAILCYS